MTDPTNKIAKDFGTKYIDNPKKVAYKHATSWKAGCLAVLIGLCLFSYLGFRGFMLVSNWYDSNQVRFQSPVRLYMPVVIEKRAVKTINSVKVVDTSIEDKKLAKINELYRKVRFIESNAGMSKNDTGTHAYCQSIGMVNELGYFLNGDKHYCFKDYNEQFTTFKNWWMKALDNGTVDENLCIWNLGNTGTPQCNYSMKIASLN